MERPKTPEEREREIDRIIENFALQEEMSFDDMKGFLVGWVDLLDGGEDVGEFFEEIIEKLTGSGISEEELIQYARNKREGDLE